MPDVAQALADRVGRRAHVHVHRAHRVSGSRSGAPVTAATFKHTIERALSPRLGGYASTFMGDIVGMPAFQARRTAHLAGVTASGDRLQIRLTAPVARPPGADRDAALLRRPGRHANDRATPADPVGRPLLHRLELPRPAGAGTQPELRRPQAPNPQPDRLLVRRGSAARGQAGRERAAATTSMRPRFPAVATRPTRWRSCSDSNGATVPPAPRHELATSGTSSTRGWTWSTSSSTPRVRCSRRRGCVAPSTTPSTAGRSCSTTSSSTAGGRPTTTSYRNTRVPSGRHLSARRSQPGQGPRCWRRVSTRTPPYTSPPAHRSSCRTPGSSKPTSRAIGITVDITALPIDRPSIAAWSGQASHGTSPLRTGAPTSPTRSR